MLQELIVKSPPQNKVQVPARFPDCAYHLASDDKLLVLHHMDIYRVKLVLASFHWALCYNRWWEMWFEVAFWTESKGRRQSHHSSLYTEKLRHDAMPCALPGELLLYWSSWCETGAFLSCHQLAQGVEPGAGQLVPWRVHLPALSRVSSKKCINGSMKFCSCEFCFWVKTVQLVVSNFCRVF